MKTANARLPYASTLQLDSEWITDSPAVRGEKQWERYTNNNAGHLDWTSKTNNHEVRTPYIHGASLVQTEEEPKKAAAPVNISSAPLIAKGAVNSNTNGAARGEKQWQGWAQAHVDVLDYTTNKANTKLPYASTLTQFVTDDTPSVRGEKQWSVYTGDHKSHLDWDVNANIHEIRTPYRSAQVQLEADVKEDPQPYQYLGKGLSTTPILVAKGMMTTKTGANARGEK